VSQRRTVLLAGIGMLAATTRSGAARAPDGRPASSSDTTGSLQPWAERSTAPGVIAAYDFSEPPVNGGTWQWGSLSRQPKVTVEAQGESDPKVSANRKVDRTLFPNGSTASLRWDVPGQSGERSDLWRISIDNYEDQFGENSEFWVQWRTRLNPLMAHFLFKDRGGPRSLTAFKHALFGEGMQRPNVGGVSTRRKYYGFDGPGTQIDNVLADTRSDSDHEIAFIHSNVFDPGAGLDRGFKYPLIYHSKYFYGTETKGQDANYYTYANRGNEAKHVADCQYVIQGGGRGAEYTDLRTCFIYPADEWFTLMLHVKAGPFGTGISSLSGGSMQGYTDSTLEVWAAYDGAKLQMLHRRTGVVLRTNPVLGPQGPQRYGTFGWTTFMTHKDFDQIHPLAQIWVSQIIIRSGPLPPASPA